MKRRILSAALVVLLLLCGCGRTEEPISMIQPVSFYYRCADTDFTAENGVIQAEVRDLGSGSFTDYEILSLYFEGPMSKNLISPISQDTKLEKVVRIGSRLEVNLIQSINAYSELDHTLINVCIAKTALSLDGVNKVRINIHSQGGARISDEVFTGSSFLLYDSLETPNTMEITLYYADESGSFLVPVKKTVSQMSDEALADYVLDLLCSKPQGSGMQSLVPPGTELMEEIKIQNGLCSVDFFPQETPVQEQAQMLAVLSVVNTLCKLDSINQVQIYFSGLRVKPGDVPYYQYLDLSAPWTSDSDVIGPVREELGEFAGVLCLPGAEPDPYLHRLTVRARAKSGASKEEALLHTLFSRTAQNGLTVPFSDTAAVISVSTLDKVCTVDLENGTLPEAEPTRSLAIRSIAATLASLPEVEAVRILEGGVPAAEGELVPQNSWFLDAEGLDQN